MSAELKECPFCGGKDTTIIPQGRVWGGKSYGEPTSYLIRHHCEPIEGQPTRSIDRIGRDEPSAIRAWNKRSGQADDGFDLWREMTRENAGDITAKQATVRVCLISDAVCMRDCDEGHCQQEIAKDEKKPLTLSVTRNGAPLQDQQVGIRQFAEASRRPSSAIEPKSQGGLKACETTLESTGVFKGAAGLSGLVERQAFWDEQPYGTRLYYGPGVADYLHRDVLRAAVIALSTQPQAPQGAVTGWQPIETAPAMKTVLACNRLGYVGPAIMDNAGRWNHIGAPTHWMPLPATPETPEGKK